MKKTKIKVPKEIKFISEWSEYKLPKGHCIVDKGVTGCGYTEFCLTNEDNIVLCSPRKLLLENKCEQHERDYNIYYAENTITDFKDSKSFEDLVEDHIIKYANPFKSSPCKLLVTYDSAFRVANVLRKHNLLDKFHFVIDEFQSIFLDSYFKSDVEFDFVDSLNDCPNVLYLSATPMLDKYLEKVDEFKDLDYYYLDWSDTNAVETVVIKRKFAKSLSRECSKIIEKYLSGKFDVILSGNKVVQSKEAVFYFNSISEIARVIKSTKLTPDQVNIICSNTEGNKARLQKLTRDMFGSGSKVKYLIGKIPLPSKGETNKMFTFCTKTAYIGADFYSTCAKTYVFADPNLECLALDISLDLPQIVGRQRNRQNPFKNDITIFYRTIRDSNISNREEFEALKMKKIEESYTVLSLYNKGTGKEKSKYLTQISDSILVSQYSKDFISISKKLNEPVYNKFIELADERAWEVSQVDYQDKISVTKVLGSVSSKIENYLDESEKIAQEFLDNHFYKTNLFHEKMKMYCEFMDQHKNNPEIEEIIFHKISDDRFRKYYNFYGTSGCSARKYREGELYNGMHDKSKEDILKTAILNTFKVGDRYTLKDIKSMLSVLYKENEIVSKTPKATDLGNYFTLTSIKFYDPETKKRTAGFRLDPL